jgi:hypothetical protein
MALGAQYHQRGVANIYQWLGGGGGENVPAQKRKCAAYRWRIMEKCGNGVVAIRPIQW